jgi:hypothetical protein
MEICRDCDLHGSKREKSHGIENVSQQVRVSIESNKTTRAGPSAWKQDTCLSVKL